MNLQQSTSPQREWGIRRLLLPLLVCLLAMVAGQSRAQDVTSEDVRQWRQAAEQGEAWAQHNLGLCYNDGWGGLTQNYYEAVKWYRKAAEQGFALAQNNLGLCYENGNGVAQNYYEAVKWYRKAAEQGYSMAQYKMGDCYYRGNGMTQDYYEAAKWYRKAAEQGYASAQYRLGNCYYLGEGVTKNHTEAVKWYRKAAEQGNEWAENILTALSKITTTEADDEANDEAFDDAATSTATVIDAGSTASTSTAQGKSTNTNTAISTSCVGTINGHEYVDLGLSVLWATCNVGASSPSGYGNYYAWGETSTKSSYTSDNYEYDLGWEEAQDIGENISGTEYDAARANWGAAWRMPTLDELKELEEKCTWTWTSQDGHYGYRVTGPNGKSIFLSAAGYYGDEGQYCGLEGQYWSSVVEYYWDYPVYDVWEEGEMEKYCDFAHILRISSSGCTRDTKVREYGRSIRPVIDAGSTASTSTTSRPAVTSTHTTTVVAAPLTTYADFFPVYGVLLGKTTVSEARSRGLIVERIGNYDSYSTDVKDLKLGDYDHDGCFEHLFLSGYDEIPEKWKQLGFDWQLSYDEWLELFQEMGFTIKHEKEPTVELYMGKNVLSAKFVATIPDQTLKITLEFNHNNLTNEAYPTQSKSSLELIAFDLLQLPSVLPANDGIYTRPLIATMPEVNRYFSDFFPVGNITLGKTTVSDLEAQGYAVTNDTYAKYATVDGMSLTCFLNDVVQIIQLNLGSTKMPERWERLGLDWDRSYNECLMLFKKMGFKVKHEERPKKSSGGSFRAEFKATASDGSFTMSLDFDHMGMYGAADEDSRGTLIRISVSRY